MRNQFPPSSAYSEAPVGSFSHHHNVQPPPLPQQYSYHQPGGHTHGSSNRRGRNFQMPPGYDMCDSAPTEPLSYHGVNDRKVLQTTEVALQNLRQDVDTQRMAQVITYTLPFVRFSPLLPLFSVYWRIICCRKLRLGFQ